MKIIKIASCLSTDDEGRYFEECPYVVGIYGHWRCTNINGQFLVPVEGLPPWCPLESEKEPPLAQGGGCNSPEKGGKNRA
jgi:hypothetical protein